MDDTRRKMLEKVRALAQLANPENGAFENEAAVATAAMQRLMDKYSISMAELMEEETRKLDQVMVDLESTASLHEITAWHWRLARVIGRMTHTKHYGSYNTGSYNWRTKTGRRDKRIAFYGPEDAAKLAGDLFAEWLVRIELEADLATKRYAEQLKDEWNSDNPERPVKSAYNIKGLGEDHPLVYKSSWLSGCLSGLDHAMWEQEKERSQQTSSALAIYDGKLAEAWNEHSKGLKSVSMNSTGSRNGAGLRDGRSAGASMHIGQKKVGGGPNKLLPQ